MEEFDDDDSWGTVSPHPKAWVEGIPMKLYVVVHTYGSYSDKGWSLMGVFSSYQKAQEFIDKKCFKVDPETKREEWENYVRETRAMNKKNSYATSVRIVAEQQAQLESLLRTKEIMAPRDPNWGKKSIPQAEDTIKRHMDIVAQGGVEYCIGEESLERYVQWKYGTPDADSMSIEECELDKEIPDSYVGNY